VNLAIKARARSWMEGPTRLLVRVGITANHLTVTGLALSCIASFELAQGAYGLAAMFLAFAGVCDMLDGSVARAGGGETRLGAFLDSTLDRTGEAALYVGSAWRGLALVRELAGTRWEVSLPLLALASALLVSYARARAEGLGAECRVGLMERTERMVLQIAALVAAHFWEPAWAGALAILVGLNIVTFVQRLIHVGRQL
jgi:CDP-diacylglycerol--glycerol-3-phosphate 3-phosphatidyltransferase